MIIFKENELIWPRDVIAPHGVQGDQHFAHPGYEDHLPLFPFFLSPFREMVDLSGMEAAAGMSRLSKRAAVGACRPPAASSLAGSLAGGGVEEPLGDESFPSVLMRTRAAAPAGRGDWRPMPGTLARPRCEATKSQGGLPDGF